MLDLSVQMSLISLRSLRRRKVNVEVTIDSTSQGRVIT